MGLFVEYMRQRGSRVRSRQGETLKSDTIRTYADAIRIYRSREAGQEVVPWGAAALMPLALKRMRLEDGPAGERRLSR
eukprot:1952064-Pleurochrysis_carterae.AAC.1